MLQKPENYDNIQLNEDFTPIELGGHKAVIMEAIEYTSELTGNVSLKVSIDTDKDDKQPNYFSELYKNDTREDKKWSNSAIKYISLKKDENCVRMLKSFITAVENSNPGFTYDWNKELTQLKGKKVCAVMGWEEYTKQDGTTGLSTKITQFRSLDKLDTIQIPRVKTLDGTLVDYDDYKEFYMNKPTSNNSNEIVISGDDLPF